MSILYNQASVETKRYPSYSTISAIKEIFLTGSIVIGRMVWLAEEKRRRSEDEASQQLLLVL